MRNTRQHRVIVHVRELAEHTRGRHQQNTQPQITRVRSNKETSRHKRHEQDRIHSQPEDTAARPVITLTRDRREKCNEETCNRQTQRQHRRGMLGRTKVAAGEVDREDEGHHNRVETRRTNIPQDPCGHRTATRGVVNGRTDRLLLAGRRNHHEEAFGWLSGVASAEATEGLNAWEMRGRHAPARVRTAPHH